jgi:hypothetical protein
MTPPQATAAEPPMDAEDHEARAAALRRMLANPAVKGELRTRLERLLKLGTEREILRGAMAKQGEKAAGSGER